MKADVVKLLEKSGFSKTDMLVKDDPRGPEYGRYEVSPADGDRLAVKFIGVSADPHFTYSMVLCLRDSIVSNRPRKVSQGLDSGKGIK
jgi:hypothetical protein